MMYFSFEDHEINKTIPEILVTKDIRACIVFWIKQNLPMQRKNKTMITLHK